MYVRVEVSVQKVGDTIAVDDMEYMKWHGPQSNPGAILLEYDTPCSGDDDFTPRDGDII